MASSTSPRSSPLPISQDTTSTRTADATQSVQGRLPSQLTAESRVSFSTPPSGFAVTQLASTRYVHQCRALIEHQRQVHYEERALWNIERSELLEELGKLKEALRRISIPHGPASVEGSNPVRSSASGSSYTSTGDEFWRGAGGKSDAQPIRTFSETLRQSSIPERLPSISEYQTPEKQRRSLITESINISERPIGSQVSKHGDLDGITFKKSSFGSSRAPSIEVAVQSPPGLPVSPPNAIKTSSALGPIDWNTKDAGHTPLARGPSYDTDGHVSPTGSSTPTRPEMERPPVEPRATAIRAPNERSDSYFAGVTNSQDDDPALSEPLKLESSSSPETQKFLETLDSRLQEAANASNEEPRTPTDSGLANSNGSKEHAEPEPEPKLRIKRSMNFGSEFGKLR